MEEGAAARNAENGQRRKRRIGLEKSIRISPSCSAIFLVRIARAYSIPIGLWWLLRFLLPPRVSFFFFLVAEISSHTGQYAAVAFFSSPPLLRATSCMTTAFMPPTFSPDHDRPSFSRQINCYSRLFRSLLFSLLGHQCRTVESRFKRQLAV